MFYSRNKDSFKKTTTRIQHREAHKNIINLVREAVERDTLNKLSHPLIKQQNENIKKSQDRSLIKLQENITSKQKKILDQPINCQSIYSSIEYNTKLKYRVFTHEKKVFQHCIQPIQNKSKLLHAHKQYVSMLQTKIQQLQLQIVKQKNKISQITNEEVQNKIKNLYQKQYQLLFRFYHQGRNQLVIQINQLIQCKNILINNQSYQSRIKSINQCICKGQELLEVYKRNIQTKCNNNNFNQQMDIQQMKNLCDYQQKTINFLRQQKINAPQFNQTKLLRHQINRVCSQNQQLIQKLRKITKYNIFNIQNQSNQTQTQTYQTQIQIKNQKIFQLQQQLKNIKNTYKGLQDKTFRLTYEKQCLGEILNVTKKKEEELQTSVDEYEKQINQLKNDKTLKLTERQQITIEQFFQQLEPYPQFFKLLRAIISEYQNKISILQQSLCDERQKKQKFAQWSNEVYTLLKNANLPQKLLQKHKQLLYNVDNRINSSKIQKYLRQIWSLSLCVDNNQIQNQLQLYIVSLKNRNLIIKQVDIQDGSSVAISQQFTDSDFQ